MNLFIQRLVSNAVQSTRGSNPSVAVKPPGGFTMNTPRQVRLNSPRVHQFQLQHTYWRSRWRHHAQSVIVRVSGAPPGSMAGPPAHPQRLRMLSSQYDALAQAVRSTGFAEFTGQSFKAIRSLHQTLRASLKSCGATPAELRRLDGDLTSFRSWWRGSGPMACAKAANMVLGLMGARATRIGTVHSRIRRRHVQQTPLYKQYLSRRRSRSEPLYKHRNTVYEVRYSAAGLQRAGKGIIAAIRRGHPVHVRVLTGWFHRDSGRRPKPSHSLVIDGYRLVSGTPQKPGQVQFHFRDPDGGGTGELTLDAAQGKFEHLPAQVGWIHRENGWDHGTDGPPHRYQVLSVR
jgi:hypothetical protein